MRISLFADGSATITANSLRYEETALKELLSPEVVSTTSKLALPRGMARRLPSRETAKLGINPDVRC